MQNNITKELIKAMISLQSEITPVHSDKQGQSGNRKFNYANLESMWGMLQPLLIKNNLWLTQEVVSIENDKESYDCVDTYLYHESGGVKFSRVRIRFSGSEIKQFGGSITYYRRYAQLAMFNLVSSDDPEKYGEIYKDNDKQEPKSQNSVKVIDQEQVNTLIELFSKLGKERQRTASNALRELGASKFMQLPVRHFDGFAELLSSLAQQELKEFSEGVQNV